MLTYDEIKMRKLQAIIRAQKMQIKNLKSALKVIRTWAEHDDGRYLDSTATAKLCNKVLGREDETN